MQDCIKDEEYKGKEKYVAELPTTLGLTYELEGGCDVINGYFGKDDL